MLCQRCREREATIRLTRVDGPRELVDTEEICATCAGPFERLADHWRRLAAASQAPITPEALAQLEQLQAEGAKLMDEVAGPLLPPGLRQQLQRSLEDPKLRSAQPPSESAE